MCNVVSINALTMVIVGLLALFRICQAEYFSSMDSLSKLPEIEQQLIDMSREYLKLQEQEYASFQSFIDHVKLEHSKAAENMDDYVGNPINAFTLIKRLVVDWNNLHNLVKDSPVRRGFITQIENMDKEGKVPNANDIVGAVKGIERLQHFYKISAEDFADGVINDVDHGNMLHWHDTLVIASNLYDLKQYKRAVEWFDLTLEKFNAFAYAMMSDRTLARIEIDIYEHLALAHYELGNFEKALRYLDDVLKVEPEHYVKDTKMFIEHSLATKVPIQEPPKFRWWDNYTNLCRGVQAPDSSKHKLRCYLDSQRHAMFRLAPLKVEQLNLEPDIYLYHELLNDKQIKNIIAEASANMVRSSVVHIKPGFVSDVRNSQQSWLPYQSITMQQIRRIIEQVTGFKFENVEIMQVANYGIGGQYDCHHDFFGKDYIANVEKNFIGDRIATNMFYLSDVEQGGYTVFPYANTFSAPVKGSLVSWHNLHRSLNEDYRTLHAGCPVLKGSKRIGNVWIRSGYQEFTRPCDLVDDTYKSVGVHI